MLPPTGHSNRKWCSSSALQQRQVMFANFTYLVACLPSCISKPRCPHLTLESMVRSLSYPVSMRYCSVSYAIFKLLYAFITVLLPSPICFSWSPFSCLSSRLTSSCLSKLSKLCWYQGFFCSHLSKFQHQLRHPSAYRATNYY